MGMHLMSGTKGLSSLLLACQQFAGKKLKKIWME
jgi:hypothetical protein